MLAPEKAPPELHGGWPIKGMRFSHEQATLMLDIDGDNLAEELLGKQKLAELTEHGFLLTDRPHITVLNYGSGNSILREMGQYSQAGQGVLLRDIERIATRQDWSWLPRGEFHRFVGRDQGLLKLIAMIDCPGVAQFYEEVEEYLPGVQIERHPMHITLLKKRVSETDLASGSLAGLEFSRPVNGLGHLALGYNFNSSQNPEHQNPGSAKIPEFVKAELIRIFRLDQGNKIGMDDQALHLFDHLGRPLLPIPPNIRHEIAKDFSNLDITAASALGRRLALVPESLGHFIPEDSKPKPTKFSPSERLAFFDDEMGEALEALSSTQATPQRVVTGAIVRIARFFNNQMLVDEAERRITQDPTYYHVRMRSLRELRGLGDSMLKKVVTSPNDALQTGVNGVELAA